MSESYGLFYKNCPDFDDLLYTQIKHGNILQRFINTLIRLFTSAPFSINRAAVATYPSLHAALRGVSPQTSCMNNMCMGIRCSDKVLKTVTSFGRSTSALCSRRSWMSSVLPWLLSHQSGVLPSCEGQSLMCNV